MNQPKNLKYNKLQKGKNKGVSNMFIDFGEFGIKSTERGRISSSQIESTRKVITRELKKQGKIWIRIFPDKPITKKPLEVRMGKGKGNIESWVSIVKPGTILYEISNVSEFLAKKACKAASYKLPIKTLFIKKKIYEK